MSTNPNLRKKTWPWYWPSYEGRLTAEGQKILEGCGVPAQEIHSHVHKRDQAWEIFPFPCIGEFWFLEFGITHHPRMQDIIALLQNNPTLTEQKDGSSRAPQLTEDGTTADAVVERILKAPAARRLLDLGTCVGQDLRALHAAGAPANTLYGSDLYPSFEAVGHALFLDQSTFPHNFFTADALDDSPDASLKLTAGLWDVVTMTMFFHQFDEQVGLEIATRVIPLLKRAPGSMIVGNNTGETVAREMEWMEPFKGEARSKTAMRHSRESMRRMWERAIERNEVAGQGQGEGREGGWDIWCEYDAEFTAKLEAEKDKVKAEEKRFFKGGSQRRVMFCVRRL